MKNLPLFSKRLFSFLLIFFIGLASLLRPPTASAVDVDCKTTSKTISVDTSYTVEICLDAPAAGTKSGDITVTGRIASFSETHPSGGAVPTINRLEFFLAPGGTADPSTDNGADLSTNAIYLNGSFKEGTQTTYSFTMNTADYKDVSNWEIWATATVRVSGTTGMKGDYYWSDPAKHTVTLNNGNTTDPVNTNTFTPTTSNPSGDLVIAATGDGGASDGNGLDVGNLMASWSPDFALFLGDVYWSGSFQEYKNWYHPQLGTPGSLKTKTNPVIGNHEYQATGPIGKNGEGYYAYWNNPPQYYSYDSSGWHFISLNTNTSTIKTVTVNTTSTTTYDNGGPGGVGRLTDTSKNWRTNQYVNQTVTVSGQEKYIVSNTATQLVLASAFSTVPAANTGYTINGGVAMQTKWLQDDLAANADKCIVALGHHPRFTIGDHADEATDAKQGWAWNQLVDSKVTAYLVGHEHSYQRWNPIGVAGDTTKRETQSAGGVTQLLVGTGGHAGTPLITSDSRVAQAWAGSPTNTNAGAIKLALTKNTINFQMFKVSDTTPSDSGSISCKGKGSMTGRITDAATSAGIAGVTVQYDGSYSDAIAPSAVTGSVTTDSNGYYTISNQPALNYTLTLSKSGYDNKTVSNVEVGGATTTTQNATMDVNVGTVTGTVTDAGTGSPLSGVTVTLNGMTAVTTDSNGAYTISNVLGGTYLITATKTNFADKSASVTATVASSVTQNFALPQIIFKDDFESGNTSNWTTTNNITVQQTTINTGSNAAEGNTTSLAMNLKKNFGATFSEAYYRTYFNLKSVAANTAVGVLQVRTGADGAIAKVYVETDGKLCLRNEVTATRYGCTSTALSTNAWHVVELRMKISPTAGVHEVWVDGTKITAMSTTTANLGSTDMGRLNLGEINSGRTYDIVFDDVAVYNAQIGGIAGTVVGKVTNSMTSGNVQGASVTYSSNTSTTNASGDYFFVNVPLGTQAVSVTKTGYITQNLNVSMNTAGTVTQNVSLVPTTGKIMGNVTEDGTVDVSGVTVSFTEDSTQRTTTTNASGDYEFLNVEPGSYFVTYTKTGYTTQNQSATVTAGNVVNVDSVMPTSLFSDNFESGGLTNWTSIIGMTNQQSLLHWGSWTARGYAPTAQAMNLRKTLSTANNEVFARTFFNLQSANTGSAVGIISLRDTAAAGILKAYVDSSSPRKFCVRDEKNSVTSCESTASFSMNTWYEVELRGKINGTAGEYTLYVNDSPRVNVTNVNLGTNGIQRVYLGEVQTDRVFDVYYDDVDVQKVHIGPSSGTIAGTVTDSLSNNPLSGVSVTVAGQSTTTAGDGTYQLSGLKPGVYSATFTKSGYNNASSTNVMVFKGQSTSNNVQMTGNNIGTVTGTITDAGTFQAISGVTVTLSSSGGSATTNSSGVYTISGVMAGSYTATASKTGYTTKTASVSVTANQSTSQDFALPLRVFGDDFESGNLSNWNSGATLTAQQTTVNGGSWAAEGNTTSSAMFAKKTFDNSGTYSELYHRTNFNLKSRGSSYAVGLLQPRTGSDGALMKVFIQTDGKLCVRNEIEGVNTCSTVTPTENAWHSVELRVKINSAGNSTDTNDTYEVWYDGSAVSGLSSTTANLGASNIGRLNIGEVNSGRTYDVVFDDVLIQNTYIGN